MKKLLKISLIVVASTVFSTIAINATDSIRGVDTSMLALLSSQDGVCPAGEKELVIQGNEVCVDIYEAAAGDDCKFTSPGSSVETEANLQNSDCAMVSEAKREPWRYVSQIQAKQLCARSGKRLLQNVEWYTVALAQADQTSCNIDSSGPEKTGKLSCETVEGINDLVGNVWEWTDEEVLSGVYDGRELPPSGYINSVDSAGIVVSTSEEAQTDYGSDYAWTGNTSQSGILRGGFYGSKSDGGIFTQNLTADVNLKTAGIGFRCIRDL